jgi:pimeloyl-ACP methyl ester carboxylesterase
MAHDGVRELNASAVGAMKLLRVALIVVGLMSSAVAVSFAGVLFWQQADRTSAAPASGRFVHAHDVDVYIQEWGNVSGPVVLLVHAAGGWSGVWQRTAQRLSASGYRVVAIDMPPLGYSERPTTPAYSRVDQARRLIGTLDALGVQRAIFLGHSFGARAAAEAALRWPERVAGVILVSAALALDTPPPQQGVVDTVLAWSPARKLIAATTLSNPLFTKTMLKLFVADPETVTPYWVTMYQRPLNIRGTYSATADWLPELVNEPDITSLSRHSVSFASLASPTLVLWGEKDSVTPLPQGEFIAKSIPRARLVVLPGVGHLPPIEDENAFNDAVLDFLHSHRTSPRREWRRSRAAGHSVRQKSRRHGRRDR